MNGSIIGVASVQSGIPLQNEGRSSAFTIRDAKIMPAIGVTNALGKMTSLRMSSAGGESA